MNNAEIRLFPLLKVPQVVGSFPIGYFVTANMTTWRWFTDAKIWRAEQICAPDTIRWERRTLGPRWFPGRHRHTVGLTIYPHAAANFNNREGEKRSKMQMDEKIKTGLHSNILSRFERCMFWKPKLQPWNGFCVFNTFLG